MNNVKKASPELVITLGDKDYKVLFTLNALRKIHEVTGWNIIDGESKHTPTPTDVLALLWAGMLKYQPDLKMEDVGDMIEVSEVPVLLEQLMNGLNLASPEEDPSIDKKKVADKK